MSYNSAGQHAEVFPYGYHSQNTYFYPSDGSPLGTGDESNFWSSNSPRSDSPSSPRRSTFPSTNLSSIETGASYFIPQEDNNRNQHPVQYRASTHTYHHHNGHHHHHPHISHPANTLVVDEGIHLVDQTSHQNGGPVPFVRVVKRRTTANKKERRRTQSINNAYADLRAHLINVPADTKLSKIKTLRLAISYINYLVKSLESDDDPAGGFTAELLSFSRKSTNHPPHVQVNDCTSGQISPKKELSEEMLVGKASSLSSSSSSSRKAKRRTGWPQHVWALELEQDQAFKKI